MPKRPTTRSDSVFLDSSVLFAAAYSARGHARDLLFAGLRQELALALSQLIVTETERNLAKHAPRAVPLFQSLLPVLTPLVVDPSPRMVHRAEQVIHPKDAPIVAGALAARARFLATYDRRHLLSQAEALRAAFRLIIATPDQILAVLANQHAPH